LVVLGGPVQREHTTWHSMPWVERTDAEGRLSLHCLQPDMTLFGFVEVDGLFAPFVHVTPQRDVDLGELRLSLEGRLVGRVLGPDGGPVADANVLIQTVGDAKGREFMHMAWPSRLARTNATGTFVVSGIRPGPYRVAAVGGGHRPRFADVTVTAKTPPVEMHLERGGSISGRVVNADGKPVPHSSVYGWSDDPDKDIVRFGLQPAVESDALGRFTIPGLPEEARLHVNVNGWITGQWANGQVRAVQVGTQDLEVKLNR
jgi:hypothetical protein